MGPDTTTHHQGSSGVRASTGQGCFGSKKGDQHNIGQVVTMTGTSLDVNQNPTGVWMKANVILFYPCSHSSATVVVKGSFLTHNSIN